MPRAYPGLDVFSDHAGLFPWQSRLVDVGGGVRQAVVDAGPRDGALTFLLVHGNPTWGFLYRDLIRALSRRHRVLAPDHVGFGRSDKPRDSGYYTIERHITNLERTVAACEARNVVVVVQDWGGPTGMGWATRHADQVAGVVVLNTWAFVRRPTMRLPWLFRFMVRGPSGQRRVLRDNFFVEWLLGRFGTVRRLPAEVLDAYRAPHPRPEDRAGIAAFPRLIPESHDRAHPEWDTMAAIEDALPLLADKPALIVWGARDLAFRAPQRERWRSTFHRVDGPYIVNAGHFLQEDAAEEIIGRIEAWLTTWPGGRANA
jgi:haloalkane dehalogenase